MVPLLAMALFSVFSKSGTTFRSVVKEKEEELSAFETLDYQSSERLIGFFYVFLPISTLLHPPYPYLPKSVTLKKRWKSIKDSAESDWRGHSSIEKAI